MKTTGENQSAQNGKLRLFKYIYMKSLYKYIVKSESSDTLFEWSGTVSIP